MQSVFAVSIAFIYNKLLNLEHCLGPLIIFCVNSVWGILEMWYFGHLNKGPHFRGCSMTYVMNYHDCNESITKNKKNNWNFALLMSPKKWRDQNRIGGTYFATSEIILFLMLLFDNRKRNLSAGALIFGRKCFQEQ